MAHAMAKMSSKYKGQSYPGWPDKVNPMCFSGADTKDPREPWCIKLSPKELPPKVEGKEVKTCPAYEFKNHVKEYVIPGTWVKGFGFDQSTKFWRPVRLLPNSPCVS